MQRTVAPLAQHRDLGSRICISIVTVTGIYEMVHVDCAFRLCRIDIGTYATLQFQLTATTVLHLQLYRAQRTVVLTDLVQLTCPISSPAAAILRAGRTCICIRTVDETAITPVTPRVHNDPCTDLVLVHLSGNTVSVQVELNTVVPSDHCNGMIHLGTPCMDIVHIAYACGSIVCRCRNPLPITATGNAKTYQTAAMEIRVTCMVVQPCLCCQASGFSTHMIWVGGWLQHTVEESLVPFLIALHPTEVIIIGIRIAAVDTAGSDTAIGLGTRDTHMLHKCILAAITVCKQPHKVRRIAVVQIRCICITERVHLMSEHIADTAC